MQFHKTGFNPSFVAEELLEICIYWNPIGNQKDESEDIRKMKIDEKDKNGKYNSKTIDQWGHGFVCSRLQHGW